MLGDDITQDEAFADANDVLKNAVGGIAEIINEYGNVNVDFEDVRTVMGEPGKAMMAPPRQRPGPRPHSLPSRPWPARRSKASTSGAKGVLVLVTAARAP